MITQVDFVQFDSKGANYFLYHLQQKGLTVEF